MPMWVSPEFINEITDYEKVILGSTEVRFLYLISTREARSAYKIFTYLKRCEEEGIESIKSMEYKNVHKRVKRLETLGLIEIEEIGKRKEINYRLTSKGLFQCFLEASPPLIRRTLAKNRYMNNIILKTILYQFFEPETLRHFTRHREGRFTRSIS